MEKLLTPFGEIKILIDGKEVPYGLKEGRRLKECPNILGRYHIFVDFIPDGNKHNIECVFDTDFSYKTNIESGEDLECQAFFKDDGIKMSIGVKADIGFEEYGYDYTAAYLKNGMSYLIDEKTKTDSYVFGICWINNMHFYDDSKQALYRDSETWFCADPSYEL